MTELGFKVKVIRSDAIDVPRIKALSPSHIVLSPGPCTPNEAGVSLEVIAELYREVPILGVCLGHQAIAQAFGGHIIRTKAPMHGKQDQVCHQGNGVFRGLPSPLKVARYHSLEVDRVSLPYELKINCESADGIIMGLHHQTYPTIGVQFHPESVLTSHGHQLLKNFLDMRIY